MFYPKFWQFTRENEENQWRQQLSHHYNHFQTTPSGTFLERPVLLTFGNLGVSQVSFRLSLFPMGRRAVPTNAGPKQVATTKQVSASAKAVAAGMCRRAIDGWT